MGPPWIGQVGREKSSMGELVLSVKHSPGDSGSLHFVYLFLLLEDTGEKLQRYTDQSPLAPSLGQVSDPSALAAQMPSVADSWAQTWVQTFL